MSLYESSVPQLKKMLKNLDAWLSKAETHASSKSFDVSVLLSARLAPDQYPLTRQIQAACDAAKFVGARLGAKEAPKNPDTETTLAELRTRIAGTVSFLDGITEKDFAGAETRMCPLPWMPGKGLTGADYMNELGMPNFYFHVTTAYSIMRHNGVELGKTDFIGSLNVKDV